MFSQTVDSESIVRPTLVRSSSKCSRNSDDQGYYEGWTDETVRPVRWIRYDDLVSAMNALKETSIDPTEPLEVLKDGVERAKESLRTLHESACLPPFDFDERLPKTDKKTFYVLYDGPLSESITPLWAIIAWSLVFINYRKKKIHGISSFSKLWQHYLKHLEAEIITSEPVYTERKKLEDALRIKWIPQNWLEIYSETDDKDGESDYDYYEDTDDNDEYSDACNNDRNRTSDENREEKAQNRLSENCGDSSGSVPQGNQSDRSG